MVQLDLDEYDLTKLLKDGGEVKPREKDTTEKWFPKGSKIYNIVIVEYPDRVVVKHVGRFTKTKKHMARLK